MMEPAARCQCGRLTAQISGEPQLIGVCHCRSCQRRTGSVFGTGAYFDKAQVRLSGPSTMYTRLGHSGLEMRYSFCPSCGTTLYWELDAMPQLCSIALGTLDDPRAYSPSHSWWEQSSVSWVQLESVPERFREQ